MSRNMLKNIAQKIYR